MNVLYQSIKGDDKSNRFLKKGKMSKMLQRTGTTLYVVRLNRLKDTSSPFGYTLGNSKPCPHCQQLLSQYNVSKIKYTDVVDGKNVLCELRIRTSKELKNCVYK